MSGKHFPPPEEPLRILCVVDPMWGACGHGFARAFQRLGHAVRILSPSEFVPPGWEELPLRILRRALRPALVRSMERALLAEVRAWKPDALFVYKGTWVTPAAVRGARALGCAAVNVYPDVSLLVHGPYIPRAMREYDWVFTTKTFGLADLKNVLGVERASYLVHSYDPEVHRPPHLSERDRRDYGCDIAFAGGWSPKKQTLLEFVATSLPDAHMRIWGAGWDTKGVRIPGLVQGRSVYGDEYARALAAARVNLAILSEVRPGASDGDHITTRSFEIPACGGFLLHERTDELQSLFTEGKECAAFASAEEAVEKTRWYLDHEEERLRIAAAGRRRAESAGYAVDHRAAEVVSGIRRILRECP